MKSQKLQRIGGRKRQRMNAITLSANPLCVDCLARGIVTPATEVDHIVALVNGGADDIANRQGLCVECHKDKTRRDLGQRARTGCDVSGQPLGGAHHWNQDRGVAEADGGAVATIDMGVGASNP